MSTRSAPSKTRTGWPALVVLVLAIVVVVRWPAETAGFLEQAGSSLYTFVTHLTS